MPRRLLTAVGVLLLALVFAVSAYIGGMGLYRMATNTDCPLPALQFEVDRSEQVGRSWLPPRVTCRHTMNLGRATEQSWTVERDRAVFPAVALASGAALIGLAVTRAGASRGRSPTRPFARTGR